MEDQNDGAKVIDFSQRSSLRIDRAPPEYRACRHNNKIVNPPRRTFYCGDCGETLDPFTYVSALACDEEDIARLEDGQQRLLGLLPLLWEWGGTLNIGPDGVTARIIGKSGARYEKRVGYGFPFNPFTAAALACAEVIAEWEKWGSAELEYPRFTITASRGRHTVGTLDRHGWSTVRADIKGHAAALRFAEEEAARRGVKFILETRPRRLWHARNIRMTPDE